MKILNHSIRRSIKAKLCSMFGYIVEGYIDGERIGTHYAFTYSEAVQWALCYGNGNDACIVGGKYPFG